MVVILVCILALAFAGMGKCNKNLKLFRQEEINEDIGICVNKMLSEHMKRCNNILLVDTNIKFDFPCIQVNLRSSIKTVIHFSLYIFTIHGDDIETTVDYVFKDIRYFPRAKYMFLLDANVNKENGQRLFSYLAKRMIYNVVVIDKVGNIFTYFPFRNEDANNRSGDFKLLSTCKDINNTKNISFRQNMPKLWRNTTLKVNYLDLIPYIFKLKEISGIEYDILKIIERKLEFTADVVGRKYPDWGVQMRNNIPYSNYLGLIQKEPSMAMGAFHYSQPKEYFDFDVTASYLEDRLFWIVPKAREAHPSRRYTQFKKSAARLLLGLEIVIAFVLYAFTRVGLLSMACLLFQISIGAPGHMKTKWLRNWFFKFIIMQWLLFWLCITEANKVYLLKLFTTKHFGYQINTHEDIVKAQLKIDVCPTFRQRLVNNESDPFQKYVSKNMRVCLNVMSCFTAAAKGSGSATIVFERVYKQLVANYMENGQVTLHLIRKETQAYPMRMFFTKGHPLLTQFDKIISRLKNSGIIVFLDQKYLHQGERALKQKSSFNTSTINLVNIIHYFYTWIGGLISATTIFILEIAVNFYKQMVIERKIKKNAFLP